MARLLEIFSNIWEYPVFSYSDRTVLPFYEMMEWDWVMQAERSDDRWRQARRVLDRGLRPGAAVSYRPIIQARAYILVSRLLEIPHQWEDHIDLLQGELILAVTYGYQVRGRDDRIIDAAKRRNEFAIGKILFQVLCSSIRFLSHATSLSGCHGLAINHWHA